MSKIELLQSVPLFSDLSQSSLTKIADKMVSRSYKKGQMILMEEALGETFFVIARGSVKVTRMSDDGREVILAMLGEGDFFGEMSLLDGEGRSANVVAIEDSEALTLKRSDFLAILEGFPKIAIHLLEELTRRLRRSDQQIESLSLSDAQQRIAITLIRLAEELGTIKGGDVTIRNLPYQQDIANMAGTSRETVSRTLKLLEQKGYLDRDAKALIIRDFKRFCKIFS
jgi:CRP-like cAMP-binding protein